MTIASPNDLERFRTAQGPIYETALAELRMGCKRSHWMWFIFPQLRGLGRSPTANRFGIATLEEARAYLFDSVLGARLRECTDAILGIEGRSALDIFGSPDDLKFRSSMTLFNIAADQVERRFQMALDRYYGGKRDEATVVLLGR